MSNIDIRLKRAYDDASDADGQRVLIDRMWPRGVRKEDAAIDEWIKSVAPSTELRKWFGHDPDKWDEFRERYKKELHSDDCADGMQRLREMRDESRLTLVFAAKDTDHNNAVVLKELLDKG